MRGERNLLLSYYGDDFTGSTDVMESLTRAGLRTILFLQPPRAEQLKRFSGLRALGVAGLSRSMSRAEMDQELPHVYTRLRELHTPIVHYKTCSTFDSSPEIGSIGYALDLGQTVFHSPFVPLVVGAPVLGRYCVFANLFARSGLESEVYRLDRHPTMRHHPITPMEESDLRIHLSRQTKRSTALFDVLQLSGSEQEVARKFSALLESRPEIVLFDVLTDEQLPVIGRLIWTRASREAPLFVVGSSGMEYALAAHWRAAGIVREPRRFDGAGEVRQLVVASGSCAPVTERQIVWGLERGFGEVAIETSQLIDPEEAEAESSRVVQEALNLLATGRSVIIHTARGPEDPRLATTVARLKGKGMDALTVKLRSGKTLGEALGRILRAVLERSGIRRAAVTGGDTCGFVARQLAVEALEMMAPIAPGGPLCRVNAPGTPLEGCEIIFKGGQVGKVNILGSLLRGAP